MKRILFFLAFSFCAITAFAQNDNISDYIRQWAPTAVREMYRSGVPASITLAQGILESRYGNSPLAAEGNNHFGIKCHKGWEGKTMAHDDDEKGECFRVYDSADESFRDHSDFLRYRDRYKFLFEFSTTDYKSWAYGLKKAGYATDPNYPAKLIKYIEDYKLYEYDTMTSEELPTVASEPSAGVSRDSSPEGLSHSKKAAKKTRKGKKHKDEDMAAVTDKIPESPLALEAPKKVDKSEFEEFHFSLSREVYSRNGVLYVLSVEGETYSSIAEQYDLFLKNILRFNDLKEDEELLPGTIVYIQPKKNQSEKGLDMYIVDEDGQALRDICQRFGVKMSSVCKMNGMPADYELSEGDTIMLRTRK